LWNSLAAGRKNAIVNLRVIRDLVDRLLLSLGYRVRRIPPAYHGWDAGQAYWEPDYLKRLGFGPRTLIDVGVAHGTPQLYEAFPNAHLLLVEPLEEFSADISRILAKRPGVHHAVAVGTEEGERTIYVEPRRPLLSSFYLRHQLEQTGDTAPGRRVRVATIDRLISETPCPRPFGLKIDAEGAELDVILGATNTLMDTEFVIAEVSVLPRFEGSYGFARFISAMAERGFEVCDILDIGRADTSDVTFFDLVFRRNSVANFKGQLPASIQ
jgi:FkbM family methyltransferase